MSARFCQKNRRREDQKKMLRQLISFARQNTNLVKNIRSLFALQIINYLLPLVTVPYVVRVVGIENFGLLSFGLAVAAYCNLVCDYGFNLSATREISLNRDNHNELLKIYSSTLTVKIALCLGCFVVLSLLCYLNEFFAANSLLVKCSFLLVVAQVLFPVWFFQGLENMGVVTHVNILSKTFFTLLIFNFVKTKEDFLLVPIFTAIGYILGALISIWYAWDRYGMRYKRPKLTDVWLAISSGFPLFLSSISISLYTLSAPIILAFTTSSSTLGAFSSADKLVQALKALFTPLTQAFYPFMSKLLSEDVAAGLNVARKVLIPFIFLNILVSALVFINAETIVFFLFGAAFLDASIYLKIMSVIPGLVLLSNILGIQLLLNLGYQREFSQIISWVGAFSVIFSIIAAKIYGATGIAWTLACTELSVVLLFLISLYFKWESINGRR